MFFLYQILISILLLLSPLVIIYRIFKNKEDSKRFIEKFGIPKEKRRKGKIIWFHGASVGEIMSIIPLIKSYEKNKLIDQILVTSSTLSSSKIIKKLKFKKIIHQFYPIDHFLFTNSFLKYWRPTLAIFIDSEIWPYMFKNLKDKKIPLILLNARITKKTFDRWSKINFFSNLVFGMITIAYPQNLETKYFLKRIKTKTINHIGNLKFAENPDENLPIINKKLKSELNKNKIWVASSTHKNEEIFCAHAHKKLKKRIKNLITIIIPRHVHRTSEIAIEMKKMNLKVAFHSSNFKSLENVDIYIVDTFGETKLFHKISSTVFMGGSIIKRGGQNPLEAARLGSKILHGPNTDNFKDVYKHLKLLNIAHKINTPLQLASSIVFKKNKNSGKKIKQIGKKILKKTINELDNLINNEYKKT